MKILSAVFSIQCEGDDDLQIIQKLDHALLQIGFSGPTNVTSVPDPEQHDVMLISYEPPAP